MRKPTFKLEYKGFASRSMKQFAVHAGTREGLEVITGLINRQYGSCWCNEVSESDHYPLGFKTLWSVPSENGRAFARLYADCRNQAKAAVAENTVKKSARIKKSESYIKRNYYKMTDTQMGEVLGLKKEQVQYIRKTLGMVVRVRTREQLQADIEKMKLIIAKNPGIKDSDLAEQLNLSIEQVRRQKKKAGLNRKKRTVKQAAEDQQKIRQTFLKIAPATCKQIAEASGVDLAYVQHFFYELREPGLAYSVGGNPHGEKYWHRAHQDKNYLSLPMSKIGDQ